MVAITKELKVGPGEDFTSFTSAVIDAKVSPHVITFFYSDFIQIVHIIYVLQSFENIKTYLDFAHSSKETTVLVGGGADGR